MPLASYSFESADAFVFEKMNFYSWIPGGKKELTALRQFSPDGLVHKKPATETGG